MWFKFKICLEITVIYSNMELRNFKEQLFFGRDVYKIIKRLRKVILYKRDDYQNNGIIYLKKVLLIVLSCYIFNFIFRKY